MPKLPRDIKKKLDLTASLHNNHGAADFIKAIDVDKASDQQIADLMNVTRQTARLWRIAYTNQYKMEGIK